jgi:hypothetical protein
VSWIVTWVASLLSQSACVSRQKYRTEKYLLHHKVMLPHSVCHSAFQFHNTYLGWTNQCNYYKISCINMLWQHDFWMKPKIFAVQYPDLQTSMKVTIPGTLCKYAISDTRFTSYKLIKNMDKILLKKTLKI